MRAPSPISALPPYVIALRLALKLFRGEPAISVFDWLFTPTHTSSPIFQHTWVRASTQCYLTFTLDMGRSHGFGSTTTILKSPYSDSLSLRLRVFTLNLATIVTRRSILQKVRRHPDPEGHRAPTACKHTVSGSISLPSRGAFHLSLTVLVHYRSLGSI